jgi:threonine dehydrogenase-like Zn-dependent dehydrogenase
MVEPTAICLTGLDRIHPRPGETAVVFGPGSLGLITTLLLRAQGIRVVLAGRSSSTERLSAARELGLTTAQSDSPDFDSRLVALAEGGVDLVVDTSGKPEALNQGLSSLRRAGRMLELGMADSADKFDTSLAMNKSASVIFSLSSEYSTWDRALALMASGAFDPAPLARTYPLERWVEAFDAVIARRVIKAMIIPGRGADQSSFADRYYD